MAAIAAATSHQLRTKATPNADPEGQPPITMFLAAGKTPYQATQHLLEGAERRNSETVLCREIVVSASPSYFRPGRENLGGVYDPGRLKAWASATLAWAKRNWPDQLASMVLHLDEVTPHAHLLVVPRTKKPDGGWKLNSKALFDRERLRELQTGYADALAHLNIKRGKPGSKAKHSEVRQFYGAIEQAKKMPQRAIIPTAPKPPKRPKGIAAVAAAIISTIGFESAYQKDLKIHATSLNAWRETVKRLQQEESNAWEKMRAMAAVAPIKQRSQRGEASSIDIVALPKVQPNPVRPRFS